MIGIKLSPGIEPGLVDSKSTVITSRPRKLDYNVINILLHSGSNRRPCG